MGWEGGCVPHSKSVTSDPRKPSTGSPPWAAYPKLPTGFSYPYSYWAPDGSNGKEVVCNAADLGSMPGVRNSPWRREGQPTPVFLPGKSHGQRNLVGCSPLGRKELDMTDLTLSPYPYSRRCRPGWKSPPLCTQLWLLACCPAGLPLSWLFPEGSRWRSGGWNQLQLPWL